MEAITAAGTGTYRVKQPKIIKRLPLRVCAKLLIVDSRSHREELCHEEESVVLDVSYRK